MVLQVCLQAGFCTSSAWFILDLAKLALAGLLMGEWSSRQPCPNGTWMTEGFSLRHFIAIQVAMSL